MMNGNAPILQAKLGDILELRWEMMALDDTMDFFVRECVAERGGSVVPGSGGPPPTGPNVASAGYGISGGGSGAGGADPTAISTPGSLLLIDKGCPTPAVSKTLIPEPVKKVDSKVKTTKLQAFRFDGSSSVRIICKLDICQGQCNPVSVSYC